MCNESITVPTNEMGRKLAAEHCKYKKHKCDYPTMVHTNGMERKLASVKVKSHVSD